MLPAILFHYRYFIVLLVMLCYLFSDLTGISQYDTNIAIPTSDAEMSTSMNPNDG